MLSGEGEESEWERAEHKKKSVWVGLDREEKKSFKFRRFILMKGWLLLTMNVDILIKPESRCHPPLFCSLYEMSHFMIKTLADSMSLSHPKARTHTQSFLIEALKCLCRVSENTTNEHTHIHTHPHTQTALCIGEKAHTKPPKHSAIRHKKMNI